MSAGSLRFRVSPYLPKCKPSFYLVQVVEEVNVEQMVSRCMQLPAADHFTPQHHMTSQVLGLCNLHFPVNLCPFRNEKSETGCAHCPKAQTIRSGQGLAMMLSQPVYNMLFGRRNFRYSHFS